MVQHQIKLRLKKKQESFCNEWLFMLSGVYNWAIRKIEQDRHGGIYYTKLGFQNLLADHGPKIGIPSHTIQGVLLTAHESWRRYFKKLGGKPKLKSKRNKLTSIPFPDPIRLPTGNHVKLPGLGVVRFHKQELPEGQIKCGRIIKRASGWYLCLFIDTQPKAIPHAGASRIGIDPGFNNLLTLSTGEKIQHPRELEAMAQRLAQAQRGNRRRFASRIQERIANQRKDTNH
ncbi:MAG: RNA-guided endonuclease InsQ/TnpB family protein [Nitrososphaerales archaeon]